MTAGRGTADAPGIRAVDVLVLLSHSDLSGNLDKSSMRRKLHAARAPTLALACRQRERRPCSSGDAKSCFDATPIHLAQIGPWA
jgi:hypothetical protein